MCVCVSEDDNECHDSNRDDAQMISRVSHTNPRCVSKGQVISDTPRQEMYESQ